MSVDADTVRKVAKLARIALPEADIAPTTEKLNGILAWVEQLAEVEVEGVEPMTSVTPMAAPLRSDAVTTGDMADAVTQNAPAVAEGFFVVPKVVE